MTPPSALALVSFGQVSPISANAATDGEDTDDCPDLAADGQGNWVVVWESEDDLGGTIGSDEDILVVRSSDDGATWTSPIALNTDAGSEFDSDRGPVVATSSGGVWIAAWRSPSAGAIAISRSLDNGASWSAPLGLGANGSDPAIATDGSGNWVVVWESADTLGGTIGTDRDILAATSANDGASWSAPFSLNTDAATDPSDDDDILPDLVTDRAGVWVAVWDEKGVHASTSTNNGSTWTAPTQVSGLDSVTRPRLATDAVGRWVAVWEAFDSLGGTIGSDRDILFALSDSEGAIWSSPAPVNTNAATDLGSDFGPKVTNDGSGNWNVAWATRNTLGGKTKSDFDIVIARSTDNAVSWSSPAAMHATAARDKGDDGADEIAYDGAGHWVAVWVSEDSLDDTIDDDPDILFATSTDDCPPAPASSCLTTLDPGRSRVRLRDGPGGKDKLNWKWKGEETLLSDFGDLTGTANLAFCIYDDVATVPTAKLETDMLGGQTCKGKPCWQEKSDGFKYKDGKQEHGAIKKARLDADEDGKAKIKLKAQGPTLGPPTLPLDQSPSITIQLLNLETGSCWEAIYSTADINDPEQFRARSD